VVDRPLDFVQERVEPAEAARQVPAHGRLLRECHASEIVAATAPRHDDAMRPVKLDGIKSSGKLYAQDVSCGREWSSKIDDLH